MRFALAVLLLSACVSTSGIQRPDASAIVDAERAFSAHSVREGWLPAFRAYAAPDAVVFAPALVNAQASLAALEDDGDRSLRWWPTFAGISRSGDFGFTTGPAVSGDQPSRLQYFTVWRRQPDGSWKWIYDGGTGAVDPAPPAEGSSPLVMAASAGQLASAEQAIAEVRAIEAGLSPHDTLERWLAEDAHVNRPGLSPAIGRPAWNDVLNRPALPVVYATLRLEASSAGDMVFSLGDAQWVRDGVEIRARYARIWHLREEGWRIAFDQIM